MLLKGAVNGLKRQTQKLHPMSIENRERRSDARLAKIEAQLEKERKEEKMKELDAAHIPYTQNNLDAEYEKFEEKNRRMRVLKAAKIKFTEQNLDETYEKFEIEQEQERKRIEEQKEKKEELKAHRIQYTDETLDAEYEKFQKAQQERTRELEQALQRSNWKGLTAAYINEH